MDRRRDGFVDNFIVDTTFETHSKSCYTVATFTMRGKHTIGANLRKKCPKYKLGRAFIKKNNDKSSFCCKIDLLQKF